MHLLWLDPGSKVSILEIHIGRIWICHLNLNLNDISKLLFIFLGMIME